MKGAFIVVKEHATEKEYYDPICGDGMIYAMCRDKDGKEL